MPSLFIHVPSLATATLADQPFETSSRKRRPGIGEPMHNVPPSSVLKSHTPHIVMLSDKHASSARFPCHALNSHVALLSPHVTLYIIARLTVSNMPPAYLLTLQYQLYCIPHLRTPSQKPIPPPSSSAASFVIAPGTWQPLHVTTISYRHRPPPSLCAQQLSEFHIGPGIYFHVTGPFFPPPSSFFRVYLFQQNEGSAFTHTLPRLVERLVV
ncbi:hypothetical protein J1614_011228 [Plenodomus biglobosus]|nr:hypothetical protein J1614_011228 [Plenodomus biglobosus]